MLLSPVPSTVEWPVANKRFFDNKLSKLHF